MKLTLHNHSNLPQEDLQPIIDALRSNLINFNLSHYPGVKLLPILLIYTKDDGSLCGGLNGRIAWDWLHVELLWVEESFRGKDYGRTLILEAEKFARQNECIGTYLDTFSFQAPDFYLKLGYEVFGQIDNQPPGYTRYFLKKVFQEPWYSIVKINIIQKIHNRQ